MTPKPNRHVYELGPFRLDTGNHLLLRDDEVIQLKPKVVETLLVLVESRGRVIGKDELIERLWPRPLKLRRSSKIALPVIRQQP